MEEKNIIRQAMKVRSFTQQMLAKSLNYTNQASVASRLRGQSIRVDTFVSMLDALGFDVIVRDRNASNRENQWVIDVKKKR